MKSYSSKSRMMLLLIFIPLYVASACQPLQPGAPSSTTPESSEKTFEANVVFGSGAYNLPDTTAGLSDLSGYKSTLTLSFDGTKAGQPNKWSKIYVMLAGKEPAARQLTIEKTGDLSNLDAVFVAEIDGAAYKRIGENACNAIVLDPANSLAGQLEPAGFLTGVIGADAAGSEKVNDVASDKYTFDERAFGQLGLAQSTGEMWVASEGGYIVKDMVTTKGKADYFGEGIEGTLTWDYELTDVNKPVTMELPADCPAGMVNAPKLPDASNILNMPSVLSYNTASSLADTAAFYQQQIPSLGWTLTGEPTTTETSALMDFTQGNQTMTVIITTDASVTTVTILLEKAQE